MGVKIPVGMSNEIKHKIRSTLNQYEKHVAELQKSTAECGAFKFQLKCLNIYNKLEVIWVSNLSHFTFL